MDHNLVNFKRSSRKWFAVVLIQVPNTDFLTLCYYHNNPKQTTLTPVAGAVSKTEKILHENDYHGVLRDPQDYPKTYVAKDFRWGFG